MHQNASKSVKNASTYVKMRQNASTYAKHASKSVKTHEKILKMHQQM